MTSNQISYAQYVQSKTKDAETARHNLSTEEQAVRDADIRQQANLINQWAAEETQRANKAREKETTRANKASEEVRRREAAVRERSQDLSETKWYDGEREKLQADTAYQQAQTLSTGLKGLDIILNMADSILN